MVPVGPPVFTIAPGTHFYQFPKKQLQVLIPLSNLSVAAKLIILQHHSGLLPNRVKIRKTSSPTLLPAALLLNPPPQPDAYTVYPLAPSSWAYKGMLTTLPPKTHINLGGCIIYHPVGHLLLSPSSLASSDHFYPYPIPKWTAISQDPAPRPFFNHAVGVCEAEMEAAQSKPEILKLPLAMPP